MYLDDNYTQDEISEIVELSQQRIGQLLGKQIISKTNILILKEWLKGELTQNQIAKQYNITQGRVAQILSEFKQKIYDF